MAKRSIKPSGKVFRDPVHGLIRIDPDDAFILELIDTPEFQRLRRVRQLGVSWLTFHGAEHSRFSHSLGVFNFAQRMLDSLMRRYQDDSELLGYLKSHAKEVKAAALLHDNGHAPFSHMFERVFKSSNKHEKQSISLVRDRDGAVSEILGRCKVSPESVADIIEGSADALLVDIVSSQLDADRMDYLLRDSYFAGVEYGKYDAEWLLNALCVALDPEQGTKRLALDEDRGCHAAEQFLLARAHMLEQVYLHRVTRGFECMLLELFRRASKLANSDALPERTPPIVRDYLKSGGKLQRKDWLRFDEPICFAAIRVWAEEQVDEEPLLQEYSRAFLDRERLFFCKEIAENRVVDVVMSLPKDLCGHEWMVDELGMNVYSGLLAGLGKGKDRVESLMVGTGDPSEKGSPMENKSELVKSLESSEVRWRRLYYRRELKDKYEDILGGRGDGGE